MNENEQTEEEEESERRWPIVGSPFLIIIGWVGWLIWSYDPRGYDDDEDDFVERFVRPCSRICRRIRDTTTIGGVFYP
jgi:hypothetical protein